jgi:carboxymethylenebutenolidase
MTLQAITTSTETLASEVLGTDAGRTQDLTVARPADAARHPGLVLLHDMFGTNPVFRELAEEYAGHGLAVALPNLFWRDAEPGPMSYLGGHPAAWAREQRFDPDTAVADIGTAAAWLRGQPWCNGKVAVLGFCFSGRLAVLAAARQTIDAAFSFYGLGIARHLDELKQVRCPVQLHYGLADEHVPQSEIDAVAAGAKGVAKVATFLYPGAGHSFFNRARPTYDTAASAAAAARVDAVLAGLKG